MSASTPAQRAFRQQSSLTLTILLVILPLTLLPVLLVSGLTYIRSSQILREQITAQLQKITENNRRQIEDASRAKNSGLQNLASNDSLQSLSNQFAFTEPKTDERQMLVWDIEPLLRSVTTGQSEPLFTEVFLLAADGSIMAASDTAWVQSNFGDIPGTNATLQPYLQKPLTQLVYNAVPTLNNQFVFISSYPLDPDTNNPSPWLIGVSQSQLPWTALTFSNSFFDYSHAFYVLPNKTFVSIDAVDNRFMVEPENPTIYQQVYGQMLKDNHSGAYDNRDDESVFSYALWSSSAEIGVVVEIPQEVINNQIQLITPVNVAIFIAASFLAGALIYWLSRGAVRPLIQLANIASQFAAGDFSRRAPETRTDEIGLLAHSFNLMADDLGELYRSLEQKVEERSNQIRIAAEVAQLSLGANTVPAMLERVVAQMVQRFSILATSVFLLEPGLRRLTLEAHSVRIDGAFEPPQSIDLDSDNPAALSVRLNQPRTDLPEGDLPARIFLPVASNNQVLGVMEVTFPPRTAIQSETVNVFQSLASQIAAAVEMIRLVETSQGNFQEINNLYQASQLISASSNEQQLTDALVQGLQRLPYISSILTVTDGRLELVSYNHPSSQPGTATAPALSIPLMRISKKLMQADPVDIPDLRRTTEFDNIIAYYARRGANSATLFPILVNGQLVRVIFLGSITGDPISRATRSALIDLNNVVVSSLQKFGVLKQITNRLDMLQTLEEFSQTVSAETQIDQLYVLLHKQIETAIRKPVVFMVALLSPDRQMVQIPCAIENGQPVSIPDFPLGEGLTSWVINNRQPLMLVDQTMQRAQELGAVVSGAPAKSWLGIPLFMGNQVMGALILQEEEQEWYFTDSDQELLLTLAPQVAIAIHNAQLLKQSNDAYAAYEEAAFLLSTLLDSIPDQLVFKNQDLKVVRASQSVASAIGHPIESLIGQAETSLKPEEHIYLLENLEKVALSQGERIEQELPINDETGATQQWLNVTVIPVNEQRLVSIRRDITTLKQAEAESKRRAQEILTASEIARETTGTLNVSDLLTKTVYLVRDRFGFYHVSVFLLDPSGEFAVLRESTGEAGEQLKITGHRLAVGSRSIVGRCTAQNRPVVANDVTSDPNHYKNPLLPDTRAEVGIPLRTGDRVIGALDVQSVRANAFQDQDISLLQTLADQVAIAVSNSDLFSRAENLIFKHRQLHTTTTRLNTASSTDEVFTQLMNSLQQNRPDDRASVWQSNLDGEWRVAASYGFTINGLNTAESAFESSIVKQAQQTGLPVRVNLSANPSHPSALAIPIQAANRVVGVLCLEAPQSFAYDANDEEIYTTLCDSLGSVLSAVDLLQQVRRQALFQEQIFSSTERIRRSVDPETILKTSAEEIAKVLRAHRTQIEISANQASVVTPKVPEPKNGNGRHAGGNQ